VTREPSGNAACRVLGMSVNVWDVTSDIETLITSRRQVDVSRLADPAVALDTL
jgi:hypothetical protein